MKVVIFGVGQIAQLAYYYFKHDSNYEIVGFTVDTSFIEHSTFSNLPVVPFDQLINIFPPDSHELFIAVSYSKINSLRKEKYLAAKRLGYRMASYISSRATILNDYAFGDNCFILENNVIQPYVSIGCNVTIWSGNHIGHHSVIHDHVFLSSHIVISGGVIIGDSCFIGVNSTLRNQISIGPRCVLGAGSLLLSDADSDGVYSPTETPRSKVPSNRLRNL
jgi:sugar O-acyltransferase (sialic acid O-acetyltransferase NeuD family)